MKAAKKKAADKAPARQTMVKIPKPRAAPPEVKPLVEVLPGDLQNPDDFKVGSDFPWTLETAETALRHIDPGIGRDEWRKVIAGLMTQFGKTPEVKKLAIARWSEGELHGGTKPKNLDAAENERQWEGFEPGYNTIGRLYQLAVKGGWDPFAHRRQQAEDALAILTGMDDSRTIAKQTWNSILVQEREHQTLFRYGRQIARMSEEIEIFTQDALWQFLATTLTFCRMASQRIVRCDPPKTLITFIMNTPARDIPLPELMGLTRTPVIAPDGTIHAAPGYSPVSKMFHFPSVEVGPVPDRPTPGQVQAARELLEEVIHDFPFVDASDRAHTLSMMILPFVRPMIDGPTPIYFLTKPVQGTGATLLGEVATLIKTGRPLEAANAPREDDEWKKTIIAKLLMLPEFFFLDNVTRIKSEALATALTADVYEGRRLGVSEIVRVPVRCTWIMTGNNPELSADFPRRIVHVRLDAGMERPEKGRDFLHPNLKDWVREQRGRLIAAILTLCRAWVVAGSPKPADARMASFESWAEVIGGILEVAGIEGFLKTPEERKQLDDPWQQTEREFVAAWLYHLIEDRGIYQKAKSRRLFKMAQEGGLEIAHGARSAEHGEVTQFGIKLRKLRDKTFLISAIDRLETEPRPEVKVKVARKGPDGDAWWVLEVIGITIIDPVAGTETINPADDFTGLTKDMFWTGVPM